MTDRKGWLLVLDRVTTVLELLAVALVVAGVGVLVAAAVGGWVGVGAGLVAAGVAAAGSSLLLGWLGDDGTTKGGRR